jgi:glycosyltransferase involved in cell wall biosynthesis
MSPSAYAPRPDLTSMRPAIDVVIPFAGSVAELEQLVQRTQALDLRPDDTLTIVDNRPEATGDEARGILAAPERQSSYFARNRGARRGSAPWLLFLDADIRWPADLLDRYFTQPPGDRAGIVAGGIVTTVESTSPVARYGELRQHVSDVPAIERAMPYAQTANALVRREAFDAVGGFRDNVRSGGDAEFSLRVQHAGWAFERRPEAAVEHPTRTSLGSLLRQMARYGGGAAWVDSQYPGFLRPVPSARTIARGIAAGAVKAPIAAARGDRDRALLLALDPLAAAAFAIGVRRSNIVGSAAP